MNKVFIVVGLVKSLPDQAGIYIGVDYGALFLIENGIKPQLAVGDFDSLTADELMKVKSVVSNVYQTKAEKDDTDTQLALKLAIEHFPDHRYIIYGGTGGRLDHFLANLFLPLENRFRKFAEQIEIIDRQNRIRFFLPGNHQLKNSKKYKYLAFIPLILTKNFEIKDVRYELSCTDVLVPTSYASNEFSDKTAQFSFTEGVVCLIESNDESSLR